MINLSKDKISRVYNLGYTMDDIKNILSLQNQPSCTTNLQITDCQSLLSYASCLDAQAFSKYQLLNILFPDVEDTGVLLNKYSSGTFSAMAKNCIPNDWNSLVDVTNKVNNLSTIEYQEYWQLMNSVEASMDQSRANAFRYLLLAGTVAAFFAYVANNYYIKYKSCKESYTI